MLGTAVIEALDELTDREKKVVRLRFGLDDGRPRTLEEVGREFGVTRERIRQIESKTLAKLRHPQRSEKLRDYLEEAERIARKVARARLLSFSVPSGVAQQAEQRIVNPWVVGSSPTPGARNGGGRVRPTAYAPGLRC